jgi:putative transposase
MPKRPPDPQKTPSTEALLRYQVVSAVLSRVLAGDLRPDAIAVVAGYTHADCNGPPRLATERTIYRWLKAFHERGLAGLEPASRTRTMTSVVLPEPLLDFISGQKDEDIRASIPEIIRRARHLGVIGEQQRVQRSTVHRACVRMGVPTVRSKRAKVRDSRRFAYPHRMDLMLSDGKHFRAGVHRLRRVAMFFLDDASRLGLHVVVGTSESTALFLRGLFEAIQHQGIAGIIYLDHGPGFVSIDTQAVIAQLPALLIHGEVRYPEGHGKIERFHRTAIDAVLGGLDGRADVDADCGALELRLRHWLRETYNHTKHESLGGLTPWQRFSQDEKPLVFPESLAALRESFVVHVKRKVTNDHVISVQGVLYETPRGLAGSWLQVRRQVLDGTVSVLHQGRIVVLHPMNLAGNAQDKRGQQAQEDDVSVLPPSAADMAFARDFQPIVGADGGFAKPEDKET